MITFVTRTPKINERWQFVTMDGETYTGVIRKITRRRITTSVQCTTRRFFEFVDERDGEIKESEFEVKVK